MVQQRWSDKVPDLRHAVSYHSIGEGVHVTIYTGLMYTMEQAEKELGQKEIILAYRYLSGDERLDFSFNRAKKVVLGEIQNAWYEVNGQDVPQRVASQQEQRLREAIMAKKEEEGQAKEKAPKEPRVTIKSICETGLLAGKSEEQILKEVKAKFPDSKADASHVRYYRHFLVKEGKLEKLPRATKPKAEKKEGGKTLKEAQAEGTSKPAQSGSRPAKASSSRPAKANA